jgi:hypothetical protein
VIFANDSLFANDSPYLLESCIMMFLNQNLTILHDAINNSNLLSVIFHQQLEAIGRSSTFGELLILFCTHRVLKYLVTLWI